MSPMTPKPDGGVYPTYNGTKGGNQRENDRERAAKKVRGRNDTSVEELLILIRFAGWETKEYRIQYRVYKAQGKRRRVG